MADDRDSEVKARKVGHMWPEAVGYLDQFLPVPPQMAPPEAEGGE